MKRIAYIFLVLMLFSVSSCDLFRKLAGRPTSVELARMEVEIKAREEAAAQEQARLERIEMEKKAAADSLAAIDTLKSMKNRIFSTSSRGGLSKSELKSRYYVIVGCFQQPENADKLCAEVKSCGYESMVISFRSGIYAVALAETDRIADALANLKTVKKEKFCPGDVWILDNN